MLSSSAQQQQHSQGTVTPNENDVLSGRGNFVNYHTGNEKFRALVRKHKVAYVACPKPQKGKFSKLIVDEIKSLGGRFLKQDSKTKLWYDIGEKKSLDKTRQALREGAPEIMKELSTGGNDDEDSSSQPSSQDLDTNKDGSPKRSPGNKPKASISTSPEQQQQASPVSASAPIHPGQFLSGGGVFAPPAAPMGLNGVLTPPGAFHIPNNNNIMAANALGIMSTLSQQQQVLLQQQTSSGIPSPPSQLAGAAVDPSQMMGNLPLATALLQQMHQQQQQQQLSPQHQQHHMAMQPQLTSSGHQQQQQQQPISPSHHPQHGMMNASALVIQGNNNNNNMFMNNYADMNNNSLMQQQSNKLTSLNLPYAQQTTNNNNTIMNNDHPFAEQQQANKQQAMNLQAAKNNNGETVQQQRAGGPLPPRQQNNTKSPFVKVQNTKRGDLKRDLSECSLKVESVFSGGGSINTNNANNAQINKNSNHNTNAMSAMSLSIGDMGVNAACSVGSDDQQQLPPTRSAQPEAVAVASAADATSNPNVSLASRFDSSLRLGRQQQHRPPTQPFGLKRSLSHDEDDDDVEGGGNNHNNNNNNSDLGHVMDMSVMTLGGMSEFGDASMVYSESQANMSFNNVFDETELYVNQQ